MPGLRLKSFRVDTAPNVSCNIRFFGVTTISDLPGKSLWSKWVATCIDEHGDTATVSRKFFGEKQRDTMQAFAKKFQEGSTWACNGKCEKGKGFKACNKNSKYSASTSPVDLEIVDNTALTQLPSDQIKCPIRPSIRLSIKDILEKDMEQRVDIMGLVTSAGWGL